jgi:hypothetical protein
MRLFFLLLLLANVSVFYWHEQIGEWLAAQMPAERAPEAPSYNAPTLVLLSERATGDSTTPVSEGATEDASETASQIAPTDTSPGAPSPARHRCASAGLFTERTAAEQAASDASRAGITANILEDEREVTASYLLLMPKRYSQEPEASNAVDALKTKGIADVATITIKDQFAVSLGIYNKAQAMEQRRGQLRAAGIEPEVRERKARRTVYTIAFEYGEGDRERMARFRRDLDAKMPGLEWSDAECR